MFWLGFLFGDENRQLKEFEELKQLRERGRREEDCLYG